MATVTELNTQPASGLTHIDGLLNRNLPGWNFLAPARTTLYYTFALDSAQAADVGSAIAGAPQAFSAAQQAAAVQAIERAAAITGITFVATPDAALADLHFAAADIIGPSVSGLTRSSYSYSAQGATITSFTAEAYVYLDSAEFAAIHRSPAPGTAGFETLLHELGHGLGLKHPFEGTVTLPPALDRTVNTLMSYTHDGGPYADFRPFDVAALMFLYGGDGLAGALGQGTSGLYLSGTAAGDRLAGAAGGDVLLGLGGDDTLTGGDGLDVATYQGARADYRVGAGGASVQALAGDEGFDRLDGIERIAFSDAALAFDLDGLAGFTARVLGVVFGAGAVGNALYAGIGLGLLGTGTSREGLMQLALDARLGSGFAPAAEVELLFRNLVGSPPSTEALGYWVGALSAGQFTPLSLALAAAELELNARNIDLVGLADRGLAYLADL